MRFWTWYYCAVLSSWTVSWSMWFDIHDRHDMYSIKRPQSDARLSWPSWLVTYRDGITIQRRSSHPSTNWAQRALTSFMWQTPVTTMPCCQTSMIYTHTFTRTRLTALFPGLPRWASTRKVKTNLDFIEARASELQWYQLGHMQICTSLQTDNHASTPPLSFLQAGCPFCHPTSSVKALHDICVW